MFRIWCKKKFHKYVVDLFRIEMQRKGYFWNVCDLDAFLAERLTFLHRTSHCSMIFLAFDGCFVCKSNNPIDNSSIHRKYCACYDDKSTELFEQMTTTKPCWEWKFSTRNIIFGRKFTSYHLHLCSPPDSQRYILLFLLSIDSNLQWNKKRKGKEMQKEENLYLF